MNSSNQHEEKSEYFINTLKNYENNLIQNVEVVNDFSLMTDNNTLDIIDVDFSEYDLVFSLGKIISCLLLNRFQVEMVLSLELLISCLKRIKC